MKTTTSLCIMLCSLFLMPINAQVSLGFHGGYTKAWEEYGNVSLPPNANIHIHGYQFAALAYFDVNKNISLGIEPGYVRRGAACVPGFIEFNSDVKLLFDYAELPIMISIKAPVYKDKFEIFGKGGFGISKILTAFQEWKNIGSEDPPVRTKIDLNNPFGVNINRWDEGIYAGIGIAYKLKANRIFLESDYYYGLKNTDKNNTSKNRSIHYNFGYSVHI